jgi:outer membrane protein assembly factor BamB
MHRNFGVIAAAGLAAMLAPSLVCGQSWGDILKDAANRRATQIAEEAIDKGLDTAEDAVRCVVTDQACIERAKQAGEDVLLTNKKGKPLPPERQPQMGTATSAATDAAAPIDDRAVIGDGIPAATQAGSADREARWETRTGFRDAGKIIVAEGVVVTGNINGKGGTFAYDAATGKRLWQAPGHLRAGPATDGRQVYSANTGVGLSAFDLKTGKMAWTAADAETTHGADVLLYEGRVFVVGDHGKMRVYEAASGKLLWVHEYSPGGYLTSCPTTPVAADGLVYYAGRDQNAPSQAYLWALDAATGEVAWRQAVKHNRDDRYGSCVTAAAVGAGVVTVASNHVVVGLDARTGVERWRRAVERRVDGAVEPRSLSAPFVHDNRVYAIFEEGLIGWDIASGRQAFEFAGNFPASNYHRMLALAEGAVYFIANLEQSNAQGNRQGFLYAVDLATARVQWKHRVNREQPYVNEWPTTYFALDGSAVYYENAGLLAKVSR